MTDKTDKDKCVLTIFHHFAHLAHGHCLQASDSDFEDRVTLFGHDKDKDNDNDKDKDFITWALSIEHCGHQITV